MGEPALRVFDGEPRLTLRGALESYVLPTLDSPSDATIQQLLRTVHLWEEFEARGTQNSKTRHSKNPGKMAPSIGTVSTDAAEFQKGGVEQIDDVMLAEFRDWCRQEKDHAVTTWNKTWRRLRQILRKLGPAERGNPTGLGKIDRVPHVRLASEPKRGKRIVSLDELDAWYRACEYAIWPDHGEASPVRQWRALLVLGYVTGLRTIDAQTLARDAITTGVHCPDEDVTHTSEFGWLCVVPRKTRRHQREIILPLSECLRLHLDWLLAGSASQLFSFGGANRHFSDQWHEITRRSGVRPFVFGDLRKTANTAYNQLRPGLGKSILGHVPRGVNETFYLDTMPQILLGVQSLPLPAAFVELADKPVDLQMRLF